MKNRIGKFFAYAIGEIVLVVIGILIALAINNANQAQKDRKVEAEIIARIHNDFKQNADLLTSTHTKIDASDKASREILKFMNRVNPPETHRTIDSLIYQSIDYRKFTPSVTTLTELLQTGNLSIIQDQELRDLIVNWNIAFDAHQTTFSLFEKWIEEEILPFLIRNISLKNVDAYSTIGLNDRSQFDNGYKELFYSREYENILDNHLYHHSLIMAEYEVLANIIAEVIEVTGDNL